jgi:hypothetical protein
MGDARKHRPETRPVQTEKPNPDSTSFSTTDEQLTASNYNHFAKN